MNPLSAIFGTIAQAEQQLIPVFIHNPQSQKIAGIIFVGEELAFTLLQQLHPATAGIVQPPVPSINPLSGAD